MSTEAHWNRIYATKAPTEVSWYQRSPDLSLSFIRRLMPPPARVIDVGGGASSLADGLLDAGYSKPIVLDISSAALAHSQSRLGSRAKQVEWVVADVTRASALPEVDLWHDRAVLHFLRDAGDQSAYAGLASSAIRPGGYAVIATFALDGPEKCSGLPVQRHDAASVLGLLGEGFELIDEMREVHSTPGGAEQRFQWTICRKRR